MIGLLKSCSGVNVEKMAMATLIADDIKCWTAMRKTDLFLCIIQSKTTISEANRTFDLNSSEAEP